MIDDKDIDDCCPEERAKRIGETVSIPHEPKTSFNLYEDIHGHRAMKRAALDKWDCLDVGITHECGYTMTLCHSADIPTSFVENNTLSDIFRIMQRDIDQKNQNQIAK